MQLVHFKEGQHVAIDLIDNPAGYPSMFTGEITSTQRELITRYAPNNDILYRDVERDTYRYEIAVEPRFDAPVILHEERPMTELETGEIVTGHTATVHADILVPMRDSRASWTQHRVYVWRSLPVKTTGRVTPPPQE